MSSISGAFSHTFKNLYAHFTQNYTYTPPRSVSMEDELKIILLEYANSCYVGSQALETCVPKCCFVCKKGFDKEGDPFTQCVHLLEIFVNAVNNTPNLTVHQRKSLMKLFKEQLAVAAMDKWALLLADNFKSIPSLIDTERLIETQKWAGDFFWGVNFFSDWLEYPETSEFVFRLSKKVQFAFSNMSHVENVKNLHELDRLIRDPSVRTEANLENAGDLIAKALFNDFPEIDEGKKLMEEICSKEYTLRKFNVTDPKLRENLYLRQKV
ncbi:MAG: hypothetical protein HYX67_05170 [Candidatus Melainabacteria bacterium]|nr:hypothetical protein [Candidatus Melainabacteria bacterium]